MAYVRHRLVLLILIAAPACAPSDGTLRADALAQLAIDPTTAPVPLEVTVADGIATVTGDVESREQQRRAVEIVRATGGISDVVDQMRLADAVIATAVERALAADPELGSIQFSVSVKKGVVSLSSNQTDADDRRRAVAVASKVDGVTRVDDLMR